jgi:hypothetical protein
MSITHSIRTPNKRPRRKTPHSKNLRLISTLSSGDMLESNPKLPVSASAKNHSSSNTYPFRQPDAPRPRTQNPTYISFLLPLQYLLHPRSALTFLPITTPTLAHLLNSSTPSPSPQAHKPTPSHTSIPYYYRSQHPHQHYHANLSSTAFAQMLSPQSPQLPNRLT